MTEQNGEKPIGEVVEEAAGEKLGIRHWDRPAVFRDAASAATDADLPYWAALTVLLPFHTITLQISARTRPTTLDLGIAVFSGLAGAVVTVARGHRLSAALPGVAISVALIPPLAVAGFGIGAGEGALVRGSLLLYGANLAGIVLSAMLVFLLIGMHRPDVLEAADRWHGEGRRTGLAAWTDRFGWVRSLGVLQSAWARLGLVLSFVVAVAIPPGETLEEIERERRVHHAVESAAEAVFQVEGRSSIVNRRVDMGEGRTAVYLRVATTGWFGEEARERFERRAGISAGEPVRVVLEQIPVSRGDAASLAELFPQAAPSATPPPPAPAALPELLASLRDRLTGAVEALTLPDSVAVAGRELSVDAGGGAAARVAYAAPSPLPPEAEQILARQLARAFGAAVEVRVEHVPTAVYAGETVPAPAALQALPALLRRHPGLRVAVAGDSAAVDSTVAVLRRVGVAPGRIVRAPGEGGGLRVRVRPACPGE
jgi:hypothetical protein